MTFDTNGLTEKRNQKGTRYYVDVDGEIYAKVCTKCKKTKILSEYRFLKSCLGGVHSYCNRCMSEREAEYRRNNRDKVAKYMAEYQRKNRDKIAKQRAEYRRNNRVKIADLDRIYRQNNQEKIVEYRRNIPHLYRIYSSRRRARNRNLPDDLTHEQKVRILEHFGEACALSGDVGDGHLDHVIPISVGHGGTIYENMIPLRADLNLSKSVRNIFDWFADNRERFGLEQRKFDELIEYLADINDMTTKEYEEYVRWCHDNPRDLTKVKDDGASA